MFRSSLFERLFRGVPEINAEAAGAFRICFGLGLLWLAIPLDFGDPRAKVVILFSLGLFTMGLWTLPAYAVSVVGFTFYAVASRRGHDWSMPLLTFWCLLAARWSDALSVDAAIRRWRRLSPSEALRGKAYGFAIWLPGLTLGTALAAAAFTKIQRSGLEWVTTGAVRFHFVEDSFNAPVDWGLWIARHDLLAILVSAGALAVEAGFLLVVFFAGWRARAVFGLLGLMLLAGFYAFQGVLWRPWWLVLIAFLPWGLIRARRPADQRAVLPLRVVQTLAVIIVVVQQAIASVWQIEIEPLISLYPMYSHTYQSPADFDRRERYAFRYWRYYFQIDTAHGVVDVTERIRTIDDAERALHQAVADLRGCSRRLDDELRRRIAAVRSAYLARYGTAPDAIRLVYDRRAFDWQRGQFYWAVRGGEAGVLDFAQPALIQPPSAASECVSAEEATVTLPFPSW